MRGFDSLKKTEEFQAVYRARHNAADRSMIMYEAEGTGRIGIVCSRKVGNSVVRHRFIRLVREAYRKNKEHIQKDRDLIVIARESAKGLGFSEIEESFISLMKRLKIYV